MLAKYHRRLLVPSPCNVRPQRRDGDRLGPDEPTSVTIVTSQGTMPRNAQSHIGLASVSLRRHTASTQR